MWEQRLLCSFLQIFNAAEMISFLHRNKAKIPEEISVAGMDDDVFATIVYPRLTTIV